MAEQLGTLEELPQDYRDAMDQAGVAPLWPMMRKVLPHGRPMPQTSASYFQYSQLRPLLLRPSGRPPRPRLRALLASTLGQRPPPALA